MATESSDSQAGGGKKIVPIVITAVGCLVVGAAAGAFALAPKLMAPSEPRLAQALLPTDTVFGEPAAAVAASPFDDDLPVGRSSEPRLLFLVENVILNPARTNGTRFLMLSVAFEVRNNQVSEQLRNREPEVRDLLLRVVGNRTVEELSTAEGRDSLRIELRNNVRALVPPGSVGRVYFPQFVIQ
jgi:flagellar protein FliL